VLLTDTDTGERAAPVLDSSVPLSPGCLPCRLGDFFGQQFAVFVNPNKKVKMTKCNLGLSYFLCKKSRFGREVACSRDNFSTEVKSESLAGSGFPDGHRQISLEKYDNSEGGYSFPIYENRTENGGTRMFIEPQAQVIVSNYSAGDHTEHNGTVVSGMSGSSVTTRVGVRLHGNVQDDHGMKQMRPFAEVNWWHGPGSQSIAFDGITVNDGLPSNRLEGKVGLQGNVTQHVSVWGSIGFEAGAHDYTAGKAQVGMKYSW